MLRPATPLSIIFFVAFVLLLLSTLSTPIINAIPLGTYQGYNFGVFGYCKDGKCKGPMIGYSTRGLFSGGNDGEGDFSLDPSTRNSLSTILIVHPIAAFFVLVCFGLACAAHFHGPSHSPRYLLALLILTIPTLLITLLAFLVDILLFVPHMQWGGWIVLAATILIISSSIITCAMRRTLVSRKARKKRIAENADMNGANYYDALAERRMAAEDQLPRADSPPPMSGTTVVDKTGQQFATFEMKPQDTHGSDDCVPLNPMNPNREPSIRSASTGGGSRVPYNAEEPPPMPMNGRNGSMDSSRPRRPSRDQYGVPVAGAAVGMAGDLPPPGLRHHGSQGSLGSNRSGGGFARGRGGFGPGPRGYGPPPPGAFGRGGFGPRGGFRGGPGGPPPPGWNGRGRGGYGPPRGGLPPRPGPPPGYARDPYYANNAPPPPPMQDAFVAGPRMPIGQAIEMDERTGMSSAPHAGFPPPNEPPHAGFAFVDEPPHAGYEPPHAGYEPPQGPLPEPPHAGYADPPHAVMPERAHAPHAGYSDGPYGLRDSDSDVAGMVGLQNGHQNALNPRDHGAESKSPTSMYSGHDQPYAAPPADWGRDSPAQMRPMQNGFRQHSDDPSNSSRALSPIAASPRSEQNAQHAQLPGQSHIRNGSGAYYEDVDPRFVENAPPAEPAGFVFPSSLTPGAPGAFPRRF